MRRLAHVAGGLTLTAWALWVLHNLSYEFPDSRDVIIVAVLGFLSYTIPYGLARTADWVGAGFQGD
jgi:hypothetical protein